MSLKEKCPWTNSALYVSKLHGLQYGYKNNNVLGPAPLQIQSSTFRYVYLLYCTRQTYRLVVWKNYILLFYKKNTCVFCLSIMYFSLFHYFSDKNFRGSSQPSSGNGWLFHVIGRIDFCLGYILLLQVSRGDQLILYLESEILIFSLCFHGKCCLNFFWKKNRPSAANLGGLGPLVWEEKESGPTVVNPKLKFIHIMYKFPLYTTWSGQSWQTMDTAQ
jgi:hypothetical protein